MPVYLNVEENQLFIMGERSGYAKGLIKMLERRFGPFSDELRNRIKSADKPALERWVDRTLEASNLDSIFAD